MLLFKENTNKPVDIIQVPANLQRFQRFFSFDSSHFAHTFSTYRCRRGGWSDRLWTSLSPTTSSCRCRVSSTSSFLMSCVLSSSSTGEESKTFLFNGNLRREEGVRRVRSVGSVVTEMTHRRSVWTCAAGDFPAVLQVLRAADHRWGAGLHCRQQSLLGVCVCEHEGRSALCVRLPASPAASLSGSAA